MAEQSKNTALFVFLVILFIFLAVIIFVFIFSTYQSTSNYTIEATKSSVECASYSFRIVGGSLEYNNNTLSFLFDPSLGGARERNSLVLIINGEEIETPELQFTFRQKIRIETEYPETFQIFPKGCKDIIRTCNLTRNKCE